MIERQRRVLATMAVALLLAGVWWIIEWRTAPPPPPLPLPAQFAAPNPAAP